MIVAGATALLTVLLGALAAYAFSRFRFKGRRLGMLSLLLIQMFPQLLAVVGDLPDRPQHRRRLPGRSGSTRCSALILVYLGGAMGVNTWLMKGFFDTIPTELDESARVDGATPAQIFWGVVLPLAAPVLAVVALISFVFTLNEFVIASAMLQTTDKFTLPVGHEPASSTSSTAALGAVRRRRRCSRRSRSRCSSSFLQRFIVSGLTAGRGQGMSATSRSARRRCSTEPHHDGSELYVLERPDGSAARRVVRLRVPRGAADAVVLRYVARRRAARRRARRRRGDGDETGGARRFPVANPRRRYRWLLSGGDGRLRLGERRSALVAHDVPDADDFVLTRRTAAARTGTSSSVVYEIFPDRFASTRRSTSSRPAWAVPRALGRAADRAAGRTRRTSGSAATCAASSSTSTTSRRSART